MLVACHAMQCTCQVTVFVMRSNNTSLPCFMQQTRPAYFSSKQTGFRFYDVMCVG